MDNANEGDKVLQTQFIRNFANRNRANFENLQSQPRTRQKETALQIKTKLEQNCWRKKDKPILETCKNESELLPTKKPKPKECFDRLNNQSRELENLLIENQT